MKQLLYFSIFCLFTSSIDLIAEGSVNNLDKVLKTILSRVDNEVCIVYEDRVSCIDLTTLEKKDFNFNSNGLNLEQYQTIGCDGENYFLDPQGGAIFRFEKDSLIKLDNSYQHKMQLGASIFSYEGSIYKYGGYGFWSSRHIITRFEPETKEWELVPFENTKQYPKGRQNAIVKVIGDDLYVIGGSILKDKNPLISYNSNEVWKFDLVKAIWNKLGEVENWSEKLKFQQVIEFNKNLLIANTDDDLLMVIDLEKNTIKRYNRTSFTRKIFHPSHYELNMFYHGDKFYGFFKSDNLKNEVNIVSRNSDEIFGELISKDKFHSTKSNLSQILLYLSLAVFIGYSVIHYKKVKLKSNKLVFKKGNLYFKNNLIEMDPLGFKILSGFMTSDEPIYSEDILKWIDKPHLDYSHKTRIIKDVIYKINFNIKSVIKSIEDPIQINKSKFDRRLKVYTLNKTLFANN